MADLKAWYYVWELAIMANKNRRHLLNHLRDNHKEVLHRGSKGFIVYLWDLKTKLYPLWQSILEMEALKLRIESRKTPEPSEEPPA